MDKKIIVIIVMLCLAIITGVLVLVLTQTGSSCPSGSSCAKHGCSNTSSCRSIEDCHAQHNNALNSALLFPCSDHKGYVCCPEREPEPNIVPQINLDSRRALLPSESECGFSAGSRVGNGQLAAPEQFPWMALLEFNLIGSPGKKGYLCGGTLISSRYILTAAHCIVTENGEPVTIRLGELDLATEKDCIDAEEEDCADPPVDVEVEKVIMHERYNMPHLKNDIALIRLKRSVKETTYIRAICLPFNLNLTENEDTKYTIAGWGKDEHSSKTGSSALLFASVPTVDILDCNEAHEQVVRPLDQTQMCAGGINGKDACKGDSGGPMMHLKLDKMGTSRTFQVGVISFGHVECGMDVPSVYTRVTAYLDWILAHLEP